MYGDVRGWKTGADSGREETLRTYSLQGGGGRRWGKKKERRKRKMRVKREGREKREREEMADLGGPSNSSPLLLSGDDSLGPQQL